MYRMDIKFSLNNSLEETELKEQTYVAWLNCVDLNIDKRTDKCDGLIQILCNVWPLKRRSNKRSRFFCSLLQFSFFFGFLFRLLSFGRALAKHFNCIVLYLLAKCETQIHIISIIDSGKHMQSVILAWIKLSGGSGMDIFVVAWRGHGQTNRRTPIPFNKFNKNMKCWCSFAIKYLNVDHCR